MKSILPGAKITGIVFYFSLSFHIIICDCEPARIAESRLIRVNSAFFPSVSAGFLISNRKQGIGSLRLHAEFYLINGGIGANRIQFRLIAQGISYFPFVVPVSEEFV